MQEQRSTREQSMKNKFFSVRSLSQNKFSRLQVLKASRNLKYGSNDGSISDKLRKRVGSLKLLPKESSFKQAPQNEFFNLEIIQNNNKLKSLLKKLHTAFIHHKIPAFYSYYFYRRIGQLRQQSIEGTINKEIKLLKEKKSHYQIIQPMIKARQGCLKQLQKSLESLFQNIDSQLSHRQFYELICHYRKITFMTITQIRQWKDYLIGLAQQQPQEHPQFIYKEQNYFLTLMNDNLFIFNSFLSKYLKFVDKNDPFLLKVSADTVKDNKYLELFELMPDEKEEYARLVDYLAEDRARQLMRKVWVKVERMKDIGRIYRSSTGQDQLKIQLLINQLKRSKTHNIDTQKALKQSIHNNNSPSLQSYTLPRTITQKIPIINKSKLDIIRQFTSNKQFSSSMGKSSLIESPLKGNYDQDFIKILRRKEIEAMETKQGQIAKWKFRRAENIRNGGSLAGRSGSFKSIRIRDSLSKSIRMKDSQECLDQLQSIVSSLQASTPISLYQSKTSSNLHKNQPQSYLSNSLLRLKRLQQEKTLLQQNEEIIFEMRNKILREIREDKSQVGQLQETRKLENQKVLSILQEKVAKEVLQYIRSQKNKRTNKDVNQESYAMRTQYYEKLTQLQEELKKEYQLRLLREVQQEMNRKPDLTEAELENKSQQEKLQKQTNKLTEKEEREKRFREIYMQQRAKIMKSSIEADELKKRLIEDQMKKTILQEKQKSQLVSLVTRLQLQEQLKLQAKENILKSIRQQSHTQKLTEAELKQKEASYRQEVRKRLAMEYKIDEMTESIRQREEKNQKMRMIGEKLERYDSILQQRMTESRSKKSENENESNLVVKTHLQTLSIEEARQKLLQQKSPHQGEKYRKLQESEKARMREEFEVELFAFMKPEKYSTGEKDSQFLIKDISVGVNDIEIMDKKRQVLQQELADIKDQEGMNKITVNKQTGLERQLIKDFFQNQLESQKFQRFSQAQSKNNIGVSQKVAQNVARDNFVQPKPLSVQEDEKNRLKLGMTVQQYEIYLKKKLQINKNRKVQPQQETCTQKKKGDNNLMKKQGQEFELIDFHNNNSQVLLGNQETNNMHTLSKVVDISIGPSVKKQEKLSQKEIMRQTVNSHVSKVIWARKDKFMTSDDEGQLKQVVKQSSIKKTEIEKSKGIKIEKSKSIEIQKSKSIEIEKSKQTQNKPISPKQQKIHKQIQESAQPVQALPKQPALEPYPQTAFVTFRRLHTSKLQQFMEEHFQYLSELIKKINFYKQDQLIKILREDYKSFVVLECVEEEELLGVMIVGHNEAKKGMRSFNLLHLGPYDEDDSMKILKLASEYLFSKDPLQQITASIFYHTNDEEQVTFVKKFQKQFEPYGAMFEKKIFDTRVQRKLVMRREVGDNRVKEKEKVNCGCFWIGNDLLVTEKSLLKVEGQQRIETNTEFGSYGMLSMYLATNLQEERLIQMSNLQSTSSKGIDSRMQHLARQSISLQPFIDNKKSQFQSYTQLSFPNALQMNMQLLKQNKQLVKCPPQLLQQPLSCTWARLSLKLQLAYPFTTHQMGFSFQNGKYSADYFRFTPQKTKLKAYNVKSRLYNSVATLLPCNNSRYKLLVMSSHEYDTLINKKINNNQQQQHDLNLNLDLYIKLFLTNISSHQLTQHEAIWLPQFKSTQSYSCPQINQHFFPSSKSTIDSSLQYYYTQYIENSLQYDPSHRNLVITPPFILAVVDSQMQLVVEGAAIVVKRVDIEDLVRVREVKVKKVVDEG